jgi:hypothetical protein
MKQIKLTHFAGSYAEFMTSHFFVDHFPKGIINYHTFYSKTLIKVEGRDDKEEIKKIVSKEFKLRPLFSTYYITEKEDAIFTIKYASHTNKSCMIQVNITYLDTFDLDKFKESVAEFNPEPYDEKLPAFNLVYVKNGSLASSTHYLPKTYSIDLENSYNTNVPIQQLKEELEIDGTGLYIFNGPPGTGKSCLIKYLSQEIDKSFYFLSNDSIRLMTSPESMEFCLNNLKDAVLILEDAETLMLDRERYKGKETANLLNLTDGLIGEMLQLKIIATLNTEEKIDKAFLRKGRLKQKVDFKPLEVTQAIQLAASLGKSVNIQKPTVLTDIYNAEDNGVTDTKQSIGFKSHG